jgi:hypothetical protein
MSDFPRLFHHGVLPLEEGMSRIPASSQTRLNERSVLP